MKILTVYNSQTGELVFTQTNATEQYNCLVEEIEDNMEVIGVDIENNRFILADRLATTEEKENLKKELEIKNAELQSTKNELETTKNELLETQASLVDSTYNNLLENGGM